LSSHFLWRRATTIVKIVVIVTKTQAQRRKQETEMNEELQLYLYKLRPVIAHLALHLHPVTPNDNTDLPVWASALYVGVGGTLRVDTVGGQTDVPVVAPDGIILPFGVRRVRATGTTASSILALA
jgi:hypothetical protein